MFVAKLLYPRCYYSLRTDHVPSFPRKLHQPLRVVAFAYVVQLSHNKKKTMCNRL